MSAEKVVEAARVLAACLKLHVASLAGRFGDLDLAVDDFQAALTALDAAAQGGGA